VPRQNSAKRGAVKDAVGYLGLGADRAILK